MKRLFLTILATLCAMCVMKSAGMSTVSHRLQPVDVYVPVDGSVFWDLTQSATCGSEVEARVTSRGDSLIEVALPAMRCVYTLRGDTLRRILTETRFVMLNDSLPLTAATPLRMEPATFPVAQRGMAFHHDFIVSEGTVTLLPDVVGTLVLSPSDTVPGVVLRRAVERQVTAVTPQRAALASVADSMRFVRVRETCTWIRPGMPFPLAHTEVSCDSTSFGRFPQVAETWVLADADAAAGSPQYAYAPRACAPRHPLDCLSGSVAGVMNLSAAVAGVSGAGLPGSLLESAAVSETPSAVTVDLRDCQLPDAAGIMPEGLRVMLTDILGRVRSVGRRDGATFTLPRGQLPPGEYLLQLTTPASSAVRKIVLH